MGFLLNQRRRLLRTRWPNAQLLAEELYTMFGADVIFDGSITIEVPPNQPAIRVKGLTDTFPAMELPGEDVFGGTKFGDVKFPPTPQVPGAEGQTSIVLATIDSILGMGDYKIRFGTVTKENAFVSVTADATRVEAESSSAFQLELQTRVIAVKAAEVTQPIPTLRPVVNTRYWFSVPHPTSMMGQIQGKVPVDQNPSGQFYSVTVYPKGPLAASEQVIAGQMQIVSSATIPVGTWATITRTPLGAFFMQVPVWLTP